MRIDAMQMSGKSLDQARPVAWWIFPTLPLLAAAIAFTWTLHGQLQRMYGMTGSAWYLAYDQQVVWSISAGQGFYSSFARADLLGLHLEPILVVLAAVEKLWPNPAVLLIFSSAGLAATGPAAYVFFRSLLPDERPASPWLAIALSAPIPFWAAIQEASRDFFQPEDMAMALALLAAWAGIRGRRVAMWLLCVLVLMCKEDQVYTVFVIGLLMAGHGAPHVRRHWRFIVYLAGAWFLIGTGVVQQHLLDHGDTDFAYYRWLVGLDPSLHPSLTTVLQAIIQPSALLVVSAVIASMFALPLLAPRWLLLAVPPYLAAVLSSHTPQAALQFHYVLPLLFPLLVAGGAGARRFLELRSIQPATALIAILPALMLGWGTGRWPPALGAEPSLYSQPNTVAELQSATSMIPANAPVSADDGLAVWLANRHTINDFPDRLGGACYIVLDHQPYIDGPTRPAGRQAAIDAIPQSGRQLLYDDGRFQVWSPVGD
ncbi:DUF2079 domain-containing protein [bacterium]|nr:MAG: DUF2079 domain-containing protein [bacterium]